MVRRHRDFVNLIKLDVPGPRPLLSFDIMGTLVRPPPLQGKGSGCDGGGDEGECTTNTKESLPQNPLVGRGGSLEYTSTDDETSMTDEDPPRTRPASPPPPANGSAEDTPTGAGGRARAKSPFEARAEEAARQRRHRQRRGDPLGGAEDVQNGDADSPRSGPRRRHSTAYQRHIKLSKSTSTPVLRRLVSIGSVDGEFAQSEGDPVGLFGERESGPVLGRRRSDIWQPLPPSNRRSISPESRALVADSIRPRQVPTRLNDYDTLVEQFTASCFAGNGGMALEGIGGMAERRGSEPSSGESRRRSSMPKRLRSVRTSMVLARQKDEAMDPNAMRYLPKILRDIYAQRQNRRGSDVSSIFCKFFISSLFTHPEGTT